MNRSCLIEALEGRQLFAATAVQDGGLLVIERAHSIQIREPAPGQVELIDHQAGTTTLFTGVTDVVLTGTKRKDTLSVSIQAVNLTVYADNDNPRFVDDVVVHNAGSDVADIFASQNDNVLTTGPAVVHR
jgi:hypothetical protein